jgi:hypothetical protein
MHSASLHGASRTRCDDVPAWLMSGSGETHLAHAHLSNEDLPCDPSVGSDAWGRCLIAVFDEWL